MLLDEINIAAEARCLESDYAATTPAKGRKHLVNSVAVSPYRTTNNFTAETVPAGLLRQHSLKAGSWGILQVKQGRVLFIPDDGGKSVSLLAGQSRVVLPEHPHHIEISDDVRFCIEFYNADPSSHMTEV